MYPGLSPEFVQPTGTVYVSFGRASTSNASRP